MKHGMDQLESINIVRALLKMKMYKKELLLYKLYVCIRISDKI